MKMFLGYVQHDPLVQGLDDNHATNHGSIAYFFMTEKASLVNVVHENDIN